MVNDSLVFVNFDSDVGVGLTRYGSWLDEAARLLVHVVAALGRGNVVANIRIQALLPPPHGLIVKLARLLLQLVIAYVKCVAAEAVVAHPHLILLAIQMVDHLVIILVVIVNAGAPWIGAADLLKIVSARFHDVQTVVSLVVTVSVGRVVLVRVHLILLRLPAPAIIVEHGVALRRVVVVHFYLTRVLEC